MIFFFQSVKGKKLSLEQEKDEGELGDVSEDDEAAEMVIQGGNEEADGIHHDMLSKRAEKQREKEKVFIAF